MPDSKLIRTDRIVSADTHFEEWWFKTFMINDTAEAAFTLSYNNHHPFRMMVFSFNKRKRIFSRSRDIIHHVGEFISLNKKNLKEMSYTCQKIAKTETITRTTATTETTTTTTTTTETQNSRMIS